MANYVCFCRSNEFKVKDAELFLDAMMPFDVRIVQNNVQERPNDIVLLDDGDGGWPSHDDEGEEIDFFAIISQHLAEGSVAIFMEVGYEGNRYLVGQAIAINSKGEEMSVTTSDIYDRVKNEWGIEPTRAEY